MRSKVGSFAVLLLLALPGVVISQSVPDAPGAAAAASQAPEAVIRSSVRLVQVSVVVEDKKGNPVTDLKQEDFTLLDEGKPQHIAFFAAPAPAPALSTPPTQRASLLPPNAFTNRYDLKGQDPPGAVTVVLFDALNTSPQDQSFVRKEVIHFLETLKPQDHVAVYGLTRQLLILHDFTRDSDDLVAAAQRFSPKELAAFDASHTPDIDLVSLGGDPQWAALQNSLNNANGMISDQYTQDRVGLTVAAMNAIADHVSAIPGRKSLVWISGGMPTQLGMATIGKAGYGGPTSVGNATAMVQNPGPAAVSDASNANRLTRPDRISEKFDPLLKQVADTLNRSNISMYAIDAKGVELDSTMDVSKRGPRLTDQVRDTSVLNAEQDARDASKLLADRTGGLAFFGNNDIRQAVRRAFDDGRFAYTVAFYPGHGQWDGKFRKIKIQTKEGLHLRYRSGYYATQDRNDAKEAITTELQQAAESPLDATNLSMIITAKLAKPDTRTVELHIGIDPKQLLLQTSGDHRKGAVDLLFVQRDASGQKVSAEEQHLDLNLEEKQYEYLAKAAMVLDRHVTMSAQSTDLRVVLRDAGSGSLGSVTLPATAFTPKPENAPTSVNQPK